MDSRIVFSLILFILVIVISMIRIENFTLQQIIVENEQSNEDYRTCLNENSQLYYKSNGMYPNCASALNKLANQGFSPNDNVGFGVIKDVCPISCFSKMPSDCLEKRVKNQEKTIENISRTMSDYSNNNIYKLKLDRDVSNQQVFTSSLYNNTEILEVLNYIDKYGYPTNNSDYNNIIAKYIKKSDEENNEQSYNSNSNSNSTDPEISFANNSNMALSNGLNTSGLLGY
jgi:hypothetical protein